MTFRTRLLVIFTVSVVAAVGLVEWVVLFSTRRAFETLERQRVDPLVAQFSREFQRRGEELVRTVNGIAATETATAIVMEPDPSPYYGEASSLARAHGLDVLDLVLDDGTIVSSAGWPARFGYKEEWVAAGEWPSGRAFLRRQELPDGVALSLIAVGTAAAGDRKLHVVGGQKLDRQFLSSLVLPAGMRVLLYRNLDRHYSPANLLEAGARDRGAESALLRPIINQVRRRPRHVSATVGSGVSAEVFHALPYTGHNGDLLGILLVGTSRSELVRLESFLRWTGIVVAGAGILLGVGLSWWATARVTRPVKKLADSAEKVAAGNWNTTVETTSADEIGQLARAFNHMTRELAAQRERILQAERVAAWRELARRLAHELKNPLFPLQITVENMQRARERYPEQFDEVFREGTETLLAELSNLKQIISRFSDFAKMPPPHMEPVDFNVLATEGMKLLGPQLERARVEAKLELAPRLRPVNADPEQMTRVLRNLALNAVDAMPDGGTVTVRTIALPSGVRLEISDTGQGLTPEECARLFTPYYTTKTHGTGLGLAIVQSVVSDHRGSVSVQSEPGKGATFRIDLLES